MSMDSSTTYKFLKVANFYTNSTLFKCSTIFVLVVLAFRTMILYDMRHPYRVSDSLPPAARADKFLEVPQIVWGLNNQKIAFARACLTARLLNRTLLMPVLTANLVYKEVGLSEPIPFDRVFRFEGFNSACGGFVRLARHSEVLNRTDRFDLHKGSGRRWTKERDLDQLEQHKEGEFEVLRIVGKNPFLWHDHWPVRDYAKILRRRHGDDSAAAPRRWMTDMSETSLSSVSYGTNNISC